MMPFLLLHTMLLMFFNVVADDADVVVVGDAIVVAPDVVVVADVNVVAAIDVVDDDVVVNGAANAEDAFADVGASPGDGVCWCR